MEKDSFPQYRKLSNGRSWYLLHSAQLMEELQVMGRYFTRHRIVADILPSRLFIQDVWHNTTGQYMAVSADQYREFERWCEQNLEQRP